MNNKFKRVFLIVLDSFGVGEAPDAKAFGDVGVSTLGSLFTTGELCVDTLRSLGLANIAGLEYLTPINTPKGAYAKAAEASAGKDTTIGHWEISGHISSAPLPTFPNGFPREFIHPFEHITGRDIICNRPYSGTAVIRDFGEEHLKNGSLILYTSADSVCQIAAHEDVLSTEELYSVCQAARDLLVGDLAVGRVIARPFSGEPNNFFRTSDRRDFSLEPPAILLPEAFCRAGLDSISVGKIGDIFAHKGFTESYPTHSNAEGMAVLSDLQSKDFNGLCFANLVDFDMVYGHRRDVLGYVKAINEFDAFIGKFMASMRSDDLLIITADHGCDPAFTRSTDHTREYIPILIYSENILPKDLGIRNTFSDIASTLKALFELDFCPSGKPMPLIFQQ